MTTQGDKILKFKFSFHGKIGKKLVLNKTFSEHSIFLTYFYFLTLPMNQVLQKILKVNNFSHSGSE